MEVKSQDETGYKGPGWSLSALEYPPAQAEVRDV